MRGEADEPEAIFSYITPSQRVPQDHPLRGVRKVVDAALESARCGHPVEAVARPRTMGPRAKARATRCPGGMLKR